MQLFKVEVGEVQKTGTLAVLASNKTFTKIYVRVFYSSRNDKIRRVNKFNLLNVKDLLKAFIRTFTSRKFAFMDTTVILCVEESGLGEHD